MHEVQRYLINFCIVKLTRVISIINYRYLNQTSGKMEINLKRIL